MTNQADLQGERITIEYIPLNDAVLWDENPKQHDLGSLCESIVRYGFVDPPKFDAQLGAFVYGNGRTIALQAMRAHCQEPPRGVLHDDDGQWYIPVKFGVDQASRDVAQALAVDHNNLTLLGGEFPVWDVAKMWNESYPDLLRLLAEAEALPVSVDGDDLDALLNEFGEQGDNGDAPEAQMDRAAELQKKWGVQLGDVWEIPSRTVEGRCHRLMCGDSTSAEDVARLMEGEKWALLVTDPPYGVSYAAKNEFLNTIAFGNRIQEPMEGDHKPPEEMSKFWQIAFGNVRDFALPGAGYYVTGPQGCDLLNLLLALRDSRFPLKQVLVWAKNNHVLGRSDYNYKHEPIIYGWVSGAGHQFYGDASETSLWEIDKPQKSDLHPTTKPIELFCKAIKNNSARGELVVDAFIGSGTAMVASEQLGRLCYGMEIHPPYCAVALQRLADMGLSPRLAADSAAA